MPRRTKAESEATARAVLDVAHEQFARDGYDAVSLEAVAAAAGVTRGAVYHHYDGKQALFEAVAESCHRAVAEAVARAADGEPDPWAGFEAGCRAFIAAAVDPTRRRVLLVDAPVVLGWTAWRDHGAAHSERHLGEALTELGALGVIDRPSPALRDVLSGTLNEAARWAAGQPDPARAVDTVWRVVQPMLMVWRRTD